MNYELAKELKDAGFPQDKSHSYYVRSKLKISKRGENRIHCGIPKYATNENISEHYSELAVYAFPTLSELIEACGDRFGTLTVLTNDRSQRLGWQASEFVGATSKYPKSATGSTPEEAVARLWLSLQV